MPDKTVFNSGHCFSNVSVQRESGLRSGAKRSLPSLPNLEGKKEREEHRDEISVKACGSSRIYVHRNANRNADGGR